MKIWKKVALFLVLLTALGAGYFVGKLDVGTTEAYAADREVQVTKFEDDFRQILDPGRRVVCYTYWASSGSSISCVKY